MYANVMKIKNKHFGFKKKVHFTEYLSNQQLKHFKTKLDEDIAVCT